MTTKNTITDHAKERFAERFPGVNLASELHGAIPFGGQLGKATLMLSGCGAVFVVRGGVVVTTLTKAQALANMQATIGDFAADTEGELNQVAPPKMTDYERSTATELAQRHAAQDNVCGCQPKTSKTARNKDLRAAGINLDDKHSAAVKLYRETYFATRAELNRQWNERAKP